MGFAPRLFRINLPKTEKTNYLELLSVCYGFNFMDLDKFQSFFGLSGIVFVYKQLP
jgi:hypothetical protein